MLNDTDSVAALIRSVIERQVATTRAGKALTAFDRALVDNLVSNIVGNLTMAVVNTIEEAVESATTGALEVAA